jgi:hypothetical protein
MEMDASGSCNAAGTDITNFSELEDATSENGARKPIPSREKL